jgi:hypothetical protein
MEHYQEGVVVFFLVICFDNVHVVIGFPKVWGLFGFFFRQQTENNQSKYFWDFSCYSY